MFNQPKKDDLNDSLSDLIGGVDADKAANPVQPPANYVPGAGRPNKFKDPQLYTETCRKCGGSGVYRAPSSYGHRCFECDGAGHKTFKTSPEARKAKREQVTNRKAKLLADSIAQFTAAHPSVVEWINAKAPTGNSFATAMLDNLNHWGDLSAGKIAAVERAIQQDAERAVEAAKRIENAPEAVGVDRLKAAFDFAKNRAAEKGRGIRNLRLTFGAVVISPAGANSKNPGALYVKSGEQYLGKIASGKFFGSRECTPEQEKRVLAVVADPKAAALAYGQETGVCCVCNSPLTNKESIERGIGPVCATKFGW